MSTICLVLDHYDHPWGGTEGQVLELVKSLVARGYRVEMAVFRTSPYIEEGVFPVPMKVLDISSMAWPGAWWRLFRYALGQRLGGCRLVHVFFNDASLMVPPVFKLLGFRVVISRRDMGFWYTPALLRVLNITRHFVDRVVCNSLAVKKITERAEGYASEAVDVIYNGFPSHKGETDTIVPSGVGRVIGIVANFRPIKRMEDLIHAFAQIEQRHPDVTLHIVGGGDDQACRALATSLGVADKVLFLGGQSDVAPFIARFDVAVLCSESEGFSNAIIEYMQAGKPVVCSAVGGNPEQVEDGQHGYLYPMGDVESLVECLQRVLNNPDFAAQLGRQGRAKVEREYSLDRMAEAHVRLYQQLKG